MLPWLVLDIEHCGREQCLKNHSRLRVMKSLDVEVLFVLCTLKLGAEDLLGHAALPS
jgi:hypothetical protein